MTMPTLLEMLGFPGSYNLSAEILLTWHPNTPNALLKTMQMRSDTLKFSSLDFESSTFEYEQPRYWEMSLPIDPNYGGGEDFGKKVNASMGFGMNADRRFTVHVELHIGEVERYQNLVLQPNTRIPFMLRVAGPQDEKHFQNTCLVFQTVFVTSPLFMGVMVSPRLLSRD
jgi:hypothetical protein